ncbi:MAG: hypothetical protein M8354_07355 [Halalkalicoccus sp.]|nr:hypothetical protein [Halalkalicoccus sp.]
MPAISATDIVATRERFDNPDIVQRTPIEYSRTLCELADTEVYLEMEHLQRTGSFKTRDAYNKLQEIASGIVLLLERAKQFVEGVGATTVAALTSGKLDVSGETVVPIFSGGNLDMTMLKTILIHELTSRSQLIRLRVRIDDGPGQMAVISDRIAERGANIRTVHHIRADESLSVGEAHLEFLVETSGEGHAAKIMGAIENEGYAVDRVN